MKLSISHVALALLVVSATTLAGWREPAGIEAGPEHWRVLRGDLGTGVPGSVPYRCGLHSPIAVGLRARGTAVVDRELGLDVSVVNGYAEAAPIRSWVRLPDGLEPLGVTSWTDVLAPGGSAAHTLRVRVRSGDPMALVAKATCDAPAHTLEPRGQAYLKLFPLDVTPSGVRVHWSATTLRPLSAPPVPLATLAGGEHAEIIHGNY